MCVASTAKRRRRQAAQNFNHLEPRQRPNYKKISKEKSALRMSQRMAKERQIQNNKAKNK